MSTKDRVEVTEKRITESGIASKRLCVLPPGTLIYSMYASMGHVAELAIPATINQALLGLEFADGVEWGFAKWWLRHLQPLLIAEASSNTQDNLNADKVRNLPFPKIEFRHQSCIGNYLDKETARIDSLISEKERMLVLSWKKVPRSPHQPPCHPGLIPTPRSNPLATNGWARYSGSLGFMPIEAYLGFIGLWAIGKHQGRRRYRSSSYELHS